MFVLLMMLLKLTTAQKRAWPKSDMPNRFRFDVTFERIKWIYRTVLKKYGGSILFLLVSSIQCYPTSSTFATCDDMTFKCGDRKLLSNRFLLTITLYFPQFLTNVAIRIIWLDTLVYGLEQCFSNVVLVCQQIVCHTLFDRSN